MNRWPYDHGREAREEPFHERRVPRMLVVWREDAQTGEKQIVRYIEQACDCDRDTAGVHYKPVARCATCGTPFITVTPRVKAQERFLAQAKERVRELQRQNDERP